MANKKAKDTAPKAAKTVVETVADKAKETVKETAAKVKETTKETAAKVKDTAVKAKDTAAKAKEAVASAPAKAAKKASAAQEHCFVEFGGNQFSVAEITENAKKHWKASNNGTISTISIYVNTDQKKVYYVVNNEDRGDFDL